MSRRILYNASIINEGVTETGYVIIDGDKIAAVGQGAPDEGVMASCDIADDLAGAMLLPGVIDDQVHFREPGLTHKADIASESRAAVAGGVTSFMDMPNTMPQTTDIEALEWKFARAAETSAANFSFNIGATNNNIQVLEQVDFSRVCGVKAFLGSSTGNMLVDEKSALQRLFSAIPAVIAVHSEDEAIIRANRERYVSERGDNLPVELHPLIRSAEACYVSTARAVELAEHCGTRLHVFHLSTERELSLFSDAPIEQKHITAEVCVHHLWFYDRDYARLGNRIKCNPAVKTLADREALREALRNGRLDVVATDHAPHLLSEKEGNCLKAASGMPLVQFSLVAMLEMARDGIFTPELVVDKMCHAPARLYRIDRRGFIRPGYYADLAVVRRDDAGHTISDADVISKCGWTPFDGTVMHHRVERTFVNGEEVFNAHGINGTGSCINESVRGSRLLFNV